MVSRSQPGDALGSHHALERRRLGLDGAHGVPQPAWVERTAGLEDERTHAVLFALGLVLANSVKNNLITTKQMATYYNSKVCTKVLSLPRLDGK